MNYAMCLRAGATQFDSSIALQTLSSYPHTLNLEIVTASLMEEKDSITLTAIPDIPLGKN